jgi:hypothetical protein
MGRYCAQRRAGSQSSSPGPVFSAVSLYDQDLAAWLTFTVDQNTFVIWEIWDGLPDVGTLVDADSEQLGPGTFNRGGTAGLVSEHTYYGRVQANGGPWTTSEPMTIA